MNTKHACNAHCLTIASLYLIKDKADQNAFKYRHDRFLREIHETYAESISSIIEAGKENQYV